MERSSQCRSLCALLGALGLVANRMPALADANPAVIYAKKATWTETMVAARTGYHRYLAEQSQAAGPKGGKPFTSDLIPGEGPAQHISVDVTGW
jgi:hypothetical protein